MIETFKNIVISLLFIGIFVSILELIAPKTENKKFIYSIVGIIIIITIISPIGKLFNMENVNIDEFIQGFETENVSSNVKSKDLIKEQFIINFKDDIENKLELKGIKSKEIILNIDKEYNVDKLVIYTESVNESKNIHEIVEYINKEYNVNYSNIEVIEGE